MQVLITGKVIGDEQVERMFKAMPAVFRYEYLKALQFESQKFIGTKRLYGAIKNKLSRVKRWRDRKGWAEKVIGLFKGSVVDPLTQRPVDSKSIKLAMGAGTGLGSSGISMLLRMGMFYRNQKQMHRAMEFLENGGSISSSKYMPVPVRGNNVVTVKPYEKFKNWLKSDKLFVSYKGGKAFYFLRSRGRAKNALVYVGLKRVNIGFRLGFHQAWQARQSAVQMRLQSATDRAVKEVQEWGVK